MSRRLNIFSFRGCMISPELDIHKNVRGSIFSKTEWILLISKLKLLWVQTLQLWLLFADTNTSGLLPKHSSLTLGATNNAFQNYSKTRDSDFQQNYTSELSRNGFSLASEHRVWSSELSELRNSKFEFRYLDKYFK